MVNMMYTTVYSSGEIMNSSILNSKKLKIITDARREDNNSNFDTSVKKERFFTEPEQLGSGEKLLCERARMQKKCLSSFKTSSRT